MAAEPTPGYENVAWFGGSFSPPTIMHYEIAKKIGKYLATKHETARVCIIPTSSGTGKESVSEACISTDNRIRLCQAMVDELNKDKADNIDFQLETYETTQATLNRIGKPYVPSKISLDIFKQTYNPTTLYFVQGQDAIMDIANNKWFESKALLTIPDQILMFPRGAGVITPELASGLKTEIGHSLKNPSKPWNENPATDSEITAILSKTTIIEGSASEISSSEVRKLIRTGKEYTHLLHPTVDAALEKMNPTPYATRDACEKPVAKGGPLEGGARSTPSNRMATAHRYESTVKGTMAWANSELEHVGRIASVKDKDLQYSYALSTVNGMAHLHDALLELARDPSYNHEYPEIARTHNQVVRVMKHLIREYKINLNTIRAFNTRKVLSDFSYLKYKGTHKSKKATKAKKSSKRRSTRRS